MPQLANAASHLLPCGSQVLTSCSTPIQLPPYLQLCPLHLISKVDYICNQWVLIGLAVGIWLADMGVSGPRLELGTLHASAEAVIHKKAVSSYSSWSVGMMVQ